MDAGVVGSSSGLNLCVIARGRPGSVRVWLYGVTRGIGGYWGGGGVPGATRAYRGVLGAESHAKVYMG